MRPLVPALCLLLTLPSGCRSAGPPPPIEPTPPAPAAPPAPRLAPASAARASAVMTVVIAAPAKIAADLDGLAAALGLPMKPGGLLLQAVADGATRRGVPLTIEALASIPPDRRIAIVVEPAVGGGGPRLCAAVPAASAQDAARLEEVVRAAGGRPTAVVDGTLLVGTTAAEITSDGALALELARGGALAGDVVASVYPDRAARATGLGWQDLARELPAKIAAQRASERPGRRPPPAYNAAIATIAGQLIGALSETEIWRLVADLSPADGLLVRTELEPRAGTDLARRAAAGPGYRLEPELPITDEGTGAAAWGSFQLAETILRAIATSLPGTPGGPAALDGFLETFAGAGSCTFELARSPPSSVCSLPLKPGIEPRRALDRYQAFVSAASAWDTASGAARRAPRPRRRGEVVEFERLADTSRLGAAQARTVRAFLGGDRMKYAAAVRGGRLLQFQGATPRAALTAWGTAPRPPATPPAALAAALARTRGRDALLVVDPFPYALKMLEITRDPQGRQAATMLTALPGIRSVRTPIVLSAASGGAFTFELQIPLASFKSVATWARPFMGVMGGASPPPP